MTETLQRPSRPSLPPRRTSPDTAPRAAAVQAGLVALRVAVLGLLGLALPVLLVWASDGRAGAGWADALRTGGQVWALAHGATLDVPGGSLGLTPLGLVALPLWLHARAGRRLAGLHPGTPLGRLALLTAGPYAVLAGAVALAAGTGDVRPGLPSTVVGALLVAVGGSVLGGLRADGRAPTAWSALPARARRLLRAVAGSSAVLLAGGALLAGASLALQLPRAADLAASSDPGAVGGAALSLVGLALVPNAVVWAASWLAGPGFAVGVGTAVGPFGHELGPVPALPLLAGLPGSAAPGWVGPLALLVPLLAGALAGRLVQRDLPDAGRGRVALEAALAGPAAGLLWAVLAGLSAGPVGGERLAEVGPGAVSVGLAVTVAVAAGAVLSAVVHQHRARA